MTLGQLSGLLVLLIFFINSAVSKKGGTCEEMRECIKYIWIGPNGLYSYRNSTPNPTHKTVWREYFKKVCSKKDEYFHCAKLSYICQKQDVQLEFKEAKMKLFYMCKRHSLHCKDEIRSCLK
ncbi:hypothetical protein PoB_006696800 [Plakobranchus ocellatus]|uniref:Uncharacterized protein n=1 Tax=Plakobranchus ocellatus TaxID=259542 RepID=A0AAV4D8T9_9GAST|nr:hypothetical protein PoB_006696800 [Plakobranchus ocellatus]